jgi:hypothetical protein
MGTSGLESIVARAMGDGGTGASFDKLPPGQARTQGDAEATAPNPYDTSIPANREKISGLIDKFLKVNESTRSAFEWAAFRNLCLIAGQHDIIKLQGQVKLRNIPKYFPRTQTNKFREKRNDLISAVAQGRVPIKHLPATDDDEAHATAEIGERVRDVVYTEAALDGKEAEIAGWFIDTGNVFLYPYYDYDEKYGTVETPKHECAQCGEQYGADDLAEHDVDDQNPMCPTCGPDLENGQNGNPPSPLQQSAETELLPIGALCVDVLSMFEVRGDYRIRDSRLWTWWIRIQRYDVSYAKEKFKYSGGDEETGDDGNALSQHYLDVIASLSDQFNPQSGFGNTAQGSSKVPKVTAYTLFMLPNEDYPEGLCAKRIGKSCDNVIDIDPLDTEYGVGIRKGQKFLPLVHGRAILQSGRLLGSSPLDDAVPLQHFRNRVERAIDMEIRRMANSIWMNPKGSGVDLFNGEAGWICNYNPFAVGGTTIAKPERVVPQLQYLQYLIETLKQIDDQIERATGTYFLQGGEAPQGVTAASGLALLDQRAKKAIGPMVREWAKMFLELDKMTLEIARKHWTDARILISAGKNKEFEVSSFMKSDLQGGITMDIDYQSLFPQSEATERAEIEQLIQGGIINPQDPEQKYEVLKKFGKTSMLGSTDLHERTARIEQSEFLKTGQPPTLDPMNHNHLIHIVEHTKFANTDEYRKLPPQQKELWNVHEQAHYVAEGARRALMMQMQINPDSPMSVDISGEGAEAALQSAQSKMPQSQAGATAGNQMGSRAPKKGTTGAGPNQAKAADARSQQVLAGPQQQPADLAGAVEPGQ